MDATENEQAVRCANPDCKVKTDGRCVEGITPASDCPQFGKTLVIVETPDNTTGEQRATGVPLAHAEALSVIEAESALRQKQCSVIALVGPQNAGKTSLIAGVYELLQRGPIANYKFAGSSTFHAFEQACHDARRDSQR